MYKLIFLATTKYSEDSHKVDTATQGQIVDIFNEKVALSLINSGRAEEYTDPTLPPGNPGGGDDDGEAAEKAAFAKAKYDAAILSALKDVEVTAIKGIGKVTKAALSEIGVEDCFDLYELILSTDEDAREALGAELDDDMQNSCLKQLQDAIAEELEDEE